MYFFNMSIHIYRLTQVYLNTQSFTLLQSSVENKNDVRFTVVLLGYKNNAMASMYVLLRNFGATKQDIQGLPSRNFVLNVH